MSAVLDRQDVEVFPNGNVHPSSNARIEANRRNALRSTGPKTDEGKAKSRRNSFKHGLTGGGVVTPEEDEERLREDVELWSEELQPRNECERALIESLAIARNRLRRGYAIETAMRARASARASTSLWEEDRRLEAQRLADQLPRSRTPGLIVEKLRRIPAGRAWMVERWKELDWAIDLQGDWNDDCRNLAFDLLGAPRRLREFSTTLPRDATLDELRALARREIAALEGDPNGLFAESDEEDRLLVVEGRFWDDSPEAARFRTYDERNSKRFHQLIRYFADRAPSTAGNADASPPRTFADVSVDLAEDDPPSVADIEAEAAMIGGSRIGEADEFRFERLVPFLARAGVLPPFPGSDVKVDPTWVGLSAEELAEAIAPGRTTPLLIERLRSAMGFPPGGSPPSSGCT